MEGVERASRSAEVDAGLRMSDAETIGPPLANYLAMQIREGRYPVGSLLPPEHELGRVHGLSRYAVREAMSRLQEMGLVQKRRGLGTTVVAARPREDHLYRLSTIADLASYARGTDFLIQSREMVTSHPELESVFHADGGDHRWLRLAGIRHLASSREAISIDIAYLREDFSDVTALGRTLSANLFVLVENQFHIRMDRIEQEIIADLARPQDAAALGIRTGDAMLVVARRFFHQDEPLVLTMSRHPSQKFRYVSSFSVAAQGD